MASATGPADARFETTAAWQAAETSTTQLQTEVERNALQAHQVAEQAASTAQHKAPAVNVAVDRLEEGLSEKTNEAVAEGQSTVGAATATASGYVQQARELVGGAMATAASYLPSSIPGSTASPTDVDGNITTGNSVVSSLQSAAGTAVETAKSALSTAQQTVQPHVETAKNALSSAQQTVQPHVERLAGAVSEQVNGATSGKPAEVPATTAPLESSGGVVGGPYPATTTGGQSHVAQV